jgi:hypothetical protein
MVDVPNEEQMSGTLDRRRALHHDHPVTHLKETGVLAHLPAMEGLSVEEAHETLFWLWGVGGQAVTGQQQDDGGGRRESHGTLLSSSWLPDMTGSE